MVPRFATGPGASAAPPAWQRELHRQLSGLSSHLDSATIVHRCDFERKPRNGSCQRLTVGKSTGEWALRLWNS
jgi:hypothetical protein